MNSINTGDINVSLTIGSLEMDIQGGHYVVGSDWVGFMMCFQLSTEIEFGKELEMS